MSKNIEKIKALEKNHRLLSDNLIDAIWTVDAETLKFEYITESVKKISGYSSDEYINMPVQKRMTPDSFQKIKAVLKEEFKNFSKGQKNVRSVEVELMHKTKGLYWAEIRTRLLQETGKGMKIIGITRDITERKKAEQEKEELIRQLENSLAEKKAMAEENSILRRLLPICSGCKRIRGKNGKWWPLDTYIDRQTEFELTHTICLDCKEAFYGDQDWYKNQNKPSEE